MTTTTDSQRIEELDQREGDGLQVSLLWNPSDDTVSVLVVDTKGDKGFELQVDPELALDAFHHPFAYAARVARHDTVLPVVHST